MLPEVDYWCSPADLGLVGGERPEESVSPVTETNTTDHCLMFDPLDQEINNTVQCTR